MKILLGLALSVVTTLAFEAPAPKLSEATRARLWRAVADSNAAQLKYAQAQTALKEVQEAIKSECGGSFDLDRNGEPQCLGKKEDKEKEK